MILKRFFNISVPLLLLVLGWTLAITAPHNVQAQTCSVDQSDTENSLLAKISAPQAALPITINKEQVPTVTLSAKKHNQIVSCTIFGRPYNICLSFGIAKTIRYSWQIRVALPTHSISFPFSSFW